MENHSSIADVIIIKLSLHGIEAMKATAKSGSVYIYVMGSSLKIRIANHGRHGDVWYRYNVRSDLKLGRSFKVSGQWVHLFSASEVEKCAFCVLQDFQNITRRWADPVVIKESRRRTYRGRQKTM